MSILLREQEQLIAAKVETTYGTDATPTGAEAIMVQDITVRALEGDVAERNNFQGFLGSQGSVRLNTYVSVDFSVELSGSGDPATAPYYAALYKAAAHNETVTVDTSVDYAIATSDLDSLSMYYMVGEHQHALLGVRGTVNMEGGVRSLPRLRFNGFGLYVAPTKVAGGLTGVDFSAVNKPLPWNKDTISTLTLHGTPLNAMNWSFTQGMSPQHLPLTNNEEIILPSRSSQLTVRVREDDLTNVNWYEIARNGTTGAFALQHGLDGDHDGRIFEFDSPNVDVRNVERSFESGIAFQTLTCGIIPTAAGNDYTFTHR